MKKLKYLGLYLLFLLPTFFINFFALFDNSHCRQVMNTGNACPDFWAPPIFTLYPNFFIPHMCGFAGCVKNYFSFMILIGDVILATAIFFIAFGLVKLLWKLFSKKKTI